ncbi:hypothetical protein EDD21DRAFT_363284 [Dissophora ornata]|nr:hypothetical protein EDD21DRAFT_363284 [Dissophora ornata]
MAISESTMSLMPSLASTSSPTPFTPLQNNNGDRGQQSPTTQTGKGYDPRMQGGKPSSRGLDSGPLSPLSAHEDPYAESSYGDDFGAPIHSPFMGAAPGSSSPQFRPRPMPGGSSGRPYSPYSPQQSPYGPGPYSQQGGGYRPNGPGPGYGMGSPAPYGNGGYGGGRPPPQQMRGPGGGYGPSPQYGRQGPGPGPGSPGYAPPAQGRGPPKYPAQNGGYPPARVASPGPGGYRPQGGYPQRDPGYNQGPHQRPY